MEKVIHIDSDILGCTPVFWGTCIPVKNLFTMIILLVISGCGEGKQSTDDLITVDVTKSYPKKELILQEFMDVEYIPLETNDEFLCQNMVRDIGKNLIAVTNLNSDGDIFIFDRNGKGIRKINRKGQGGEEYLRIFNILLDEDNGEMIVNDAMMKKLIVYNLFGKFKRSFQYQEGSKYEHIYNFDKEKLICRDDVFNAFSKPPYSEITDKSPFLLISKKDGRIVKEIKIPFIQQKTVTIRGDRQIALINYFPILPFQDNFILAEHSSDTLFRYMPDHRMIPFLVRTPSIQSMNPEVFLFPRMLTDRYYFLETIKKEYDFKPDSEFPSKELVYDVQDKEVYEYVVFNEDFTKKREVDLKRPASNSEIAYWQTFNAYELVELYEKGGLKGKLKDVAAKLNVEDNPVNMIVKHKKI